MAHKTRTKCTFYAGMAGYVCTVEGYDHLNQRWRHVYDGPPMPTRARARAAALRDAKRKGHLPGLSGGVSGLSGIGGFVAGMFGASPSGPHIKVSYSTVTAESAAEGDYAESGWEDEEGMDMTPDQYDVEEGLTAVDKAVSNLRAAGAVEPSSSAYHRGVWYSGDAEEDYRTGESITRAYHLYNFTPEQEREIFDRITKRRR
jgi:hypothetical protein